MLVQTVGLMFGLCLYGEVPQTCSCCGGATSKFQGTADICEAEVTILVTATKIQN